MALNYDDIATNLINNRFNAAIPNPIITDI